MKKRLISLLLAVFMLFSLLPAASFAESEEVTEEQATEETTVDAEEAAESTAEEKAEEQTEESEEPTAEEADNSSEEDPAGETPAEDQAEEENLTASLESGTYGSLTWTLENGVLTISGKGGIPVASAPWYSLRSSIRSIVIGDEVTSICDSAFYNYTNLTTVYIGDGVKHIAYYAFAKCTGLTTLKIGNNVEEISYYAFADCTSLTTVVIPDSVTELLWDVFYCCTSLETIIIPASVTYMDTKGVGIFYKCDNLTIYCESGSTAETYAKNNGIAYRLYNGLCGDNMVWILENGMLTISGKGAMTCGGGIFAPWYSSSSSILSVVIESGVTSIVSNAFSGCTYMTTVDISDSVTEISEAAFTGCTALTSITVSANNSNYSSADGVLFNKAQTELICFPGGRTGTYIVPDSVESIANFGFSGCTKLDYVIIHTSVTAIGSNAFSGCTDLTIYCYKGSAAETYAKNNSMAYICIEDLAVHAVSEAVLNIGETYQFNYCDADTSWNTLLDWETSDSSIATVENGLVTAVGAGTATITVCESYFTVTVLDKSAPPAPGHAVSNAILAVGETYQFNYCDADTNWNLILDWETSDTNVAAVKDGLVTAVGAGTAFITVEDESYRVDVTETAEVLTSVEGVALESNKAVVELYKTDYTRLELLVKLNSGAASLGINPELYDTPVNADIAIDNVRFADPKTGKPISDTDAAALPFKPVAVDDRYVELAVNADIAEKVYNKHASVKGSYKYKLAVTIGGEEFITDALTITIKKTVPKVKASAVNICTVGSTAGCGYVTFTGAEVEAVTYKNDISWIKSVEYDSTLKAAVVTLKDNYFKAGSKGSGTMTIQCHVKGFAVTCAAKVKVTVINKTPTVTVKAAGTIENKLDRSKVVLTPTIKNGTPNNYGCKIYSVFGKTRTYLDPSEADFPFVCQWSGTGALTITQNISSKPAAGTYEVVLSYSFKGIDKPVEAKAVKITVKSTPAEKLKLKPVQSSKTATLFQNDKYDTAEMAITFDGQVLAGLNITLDPKLQSLFDFTYNEKTGVISVKWKEGADRSSLKANSSKTLKFSIYIDGNTTTKANATISLKITIK